MRRCFYLRRVAVALLFPGSRGERLGRGGEKDGKERWGKKDIGRLGGECRAKERVQVLTFLPAAYMGFGLDFGG